MDNLTAGNPVAHRVRVYYTGSDKIKEGEPLCYSFKTTRSWWGGNVNDAGEVTASEYVAEGSHNASKYMCVESPMQDVIVSMDTTAGSNVITGDGTDFVNLHVGMAVSIASETDDAFDGNYVITAVGTAGITITLDMTTAEAAAVTVQSDVTVNIENISAFAGVVAKGGWCGKTGPMVLDIYVPNGAVVPVRSDQNCVLGKTILAVHSNEQHLTAPFESGGRAVAIAWETVDTTSNIGLVLAKLDENLFIYQRGDAYGLLVDDQDTGTNAVNQIRVSFSQASGRCTVFQIRAYATGGAPESWDYGLALDVSADLNGAAVSANFNASGHWLNIGSTTVTGGSHISALRAGIYEDGSGNTFTSCNSMAPLSLAVQFSTDPSGRLAMIYMRSDGSNHPDYFFIAESAAAVCLTADASLSSDHAIKVRVGGIDYNIMLDVCD